jgi:outer membrane usher protein FimD/PapC
MRWRGALSFGASDPRYGAIALSAVRADYRAEEAVSILALDFTATAAAAFQWGLSFSHSRADRESLAVAFRLAFHTRSTSAASTASMSKGVVTVDAGIRSSPPPEGGLGWSLGGRSGDVEVAQAGVRLEGRSGVVDAAASRIDSRNAFRVQGIASIAWMDEGFYLSRLIQDSFVLADVGAPNVEIALSNRPAGRTGRDGKLLVAGARAYELNRISMQPNDLPDGVAVAEDSLQVMPSARAGTIARFPVARGRAGELRVVDMRAMPIPSGVLFIRRSDGGRFPVGRDGRVYLEGVRGTLRLQRMDGDGCVVDIAETDLEASLPVVCKVPAA